MKSLRRTGLLSVASAVVCFSLAGCDSTGGNEGEMKIQSAGSSPVQTQEDYFKQQAELAKSGGKSAEKKADSDGKKAEEPKKGDAAKK